MRVYVASKFENKEAVRAFQRLLREHGHTITYDWTSSDASGKVGKELARYLYACAEADERGVTECDALVLLCYPNMRGAWIEFGMARALGKRIVVVGGATLRQPIIFFNLSGITFVDNVAWAVRVLRHAALTA